jgi:hypothetical protein
MRHLFKPKCLAGVAALFIGAACADAHDFWVNADSLRPEPGQTVAVQIAGGHHFPQSELILQGRLIREFTVTRHDGTTTPIALNPAGKTHESSLTIDTPGVYLLNLVIQRPQKKEPESLCRAILIPAGGDDQPGAYARNSSLEIVPGKALSQLASGDELPLELRRDGKPMATQFTVCAEKGKPQWIRSTADAPAVLQVKSGTKYLVTAIDGGQTVSLVFLAGSP